ncbi:hypothetical protein [Bradyrhizobium sp. 2]|uniref:hypothetical protein n=1 Tax=Bradyrhizobium sp. 2 TaxID=190045 RepID=UPI001FFBFE42|nr:hypothetical protein [Bradyrhizobium sp. 2]
MSSQITTRFTQPVKTIADIEALEQRPYDRWSLPAICSISSKPRRTCIPIGLH